MQGTASNANSDKGSFVCIFVTLGKLSASSCSLHVYTVITIQLKRMTCTIFIPPFSFTNLDSSQQSVALVLAVTFTFEISFFNYQLHRSEKVDH
jgi:hypothetical protein